MIPKADADTLPRTEQIRFGMIDAGTRVGLLKARNSSFKWQWYHEQYNLGMVYAGGYEITTCGQVCALMPGQLILSEPGDVCACREIFKPVWCDVVFLDAEFVRSCVDERPRRAPAPHVGTPISSNPALAAALQRFVACASDRVPSLALDEALSSTIDAFLAACGETVQHAGAEQRAVQRARSILHEHLSDVVRLDDLAAAVGLNKSYFVRSFTKAIGVPPHAYQRLVRISRARRLLAAGGSASQVAQRLGFADQSHLIRVFRQTVGMTPASYARHAYASRRPNRAPQESQ